MISRSFSLASINNGNRNGLNSRILKKEGSTKLASIREVRSCCGRPDQCEMPQYVATLEPVGHRPSRQSMIILGSVREENWLLLLLACQQNIRRVGRTSFRVKTYSQLADLPRDCKVADGGLVAGNLVSKRETGPPMRTPKLDEDWIIKS